MVFLNRFFQLPWSLVDNPGLRFENMVAIHLLKWIQFEQDTQARQLALNYFRDTDGREVDFIVIEKTQPIMAIECKWSDADVSKHLRYFKKKFSVSMVGKNPM